MTGSLVKKTCNARFEFLVQMCKLEVIFTKINVGDMEIWLLNLHSKSQAGHSKPNLAFEDGCWPWWRTWTSSWSPLTYSSQLLYYWWASCSCQYFIHPFSIHTVGRWMYLLTTLISFLVLQILLVGIGWQIHDRHWKNFARWGGTRERNKKPKDYFTKTW